MLALFFIHCSCTRTKLVRITFPAEMAIWWVCSHLFPAASSKNKRCCVPHDLVIASGRIHRYRTGWWRWTLVVNCKKITERLIIFAANERQVSTSPLISCSTTWNDIDLGWHFCLSLIIYLSSVNVCLTSWKGISVSVDDKKGVERTSCVWMQLNGFISFPRSRATLK